MHLGRELVARDADRLDERLGRQLASFEAVDEDLAVGARDVHQLPLQLVGIIGEGFDLLPRQHCAERHVAVRGGGCLSRPTVTSLCTRSSGSISTCLFSPALTRTSGSTRAWKPRTLP